MPGGASLICNFYISVAACTVVREDPSLIYTLRGKDAKYTPPSPPPPLPPPPPPPPPPPTPTPPAPPSPPPPPIPQTYVKGNLYSYSASQDFTTWLSPGMWKIFSTALSKVECGQTKSQSLQLKMVVRGSDDCVSVRGLLYTQPWLWCRLTEIDLSTFLYILEMHFSSLYNDHLRYFNIRPRFCVQSVLSLSKTAFYETAS